MNNTTAVINDDLTSWFHCGHCASLFKSTAGEWEGRRCENCGEDPSLGLQAEASGAAAPIKSSGRDPMLRVKMAEVERPKTFKREVHRHKKRFFALKLVGVWALAMVLLAIAAQVLWKEKPRESANQLAKRATTGTYADEDVALLDRNYRKCLITMSGFLSAGTPEVRNQFVRTPVETAGRMARFYQMNPIGNLDVSEVQGSGGGVIHLADGRRLLETRWKVKDGREFDAVFFEERGEWRLDWEEFVRYGDEPWVLFLTGSGNAEGEFRLFVRERLAEQRSNISQLRVAFYVPRFGRPDEVGEPSPEFLIDQESPEGVMLKAAFAEREKGGRIYSSSLPVRDPDGMVRVRVKIRRSDGTLGRQFSIEELKACHWLSIDEKPAVEK